MEHFCRFLSFTKTHDSYGITAHLCTRKDYILHHPEHPEYSVVEFPSQRYIDKYVKSLEDAGIHVCYCDES